MGGTVLLLTTTGRRSGRRRTLPVTYAGDGDRFVVAASGGTETRLPTWLLNVRRDPLAHVQVGGRRIAVRGAEVSDEERERCWRRLVEVFPPFADYPSSRVYQIPVVLFEPVSA